MSCCSISKYCHRGSGEQEVAHPVTPLVFKSAIEVEEVLCNSPAAGLSNIGLCFEKDDDMQKALMKLSSSSRTSHLAVVLQGNETLAIDFNGFFEKNSSVLSSIDVSFGECGDPKLSTLEGTMNNFVMSLTRLTKLESLSIDYCVPNGLHYTLPKLFWSRLPEFRHLRSLSLKCSGELDTSDVFLSSSYLEDFQLSENFTPEARSFRLPLDLSGLVRLRSISVRAIGRTVILAERNAHLRRAEFLSLDSVLGDLSSVSFLSWRSAARDWDELEFVKGLPLTPRLRHLDVACRALEGFQTSQLPPSLRFLRLRERSKLACRGPLDFSLLTELSLLQIHAMCDLVVADKNTLLAMLDLKFVQSVKGDLSHVEALGISNMPALQIREILAGCKNLKELGICSVNGYGLGVIDASRLDVLFLACLELDEIITSPSKPLEAIFIDDVCFDTEPRQLIHAKQIYMAWLDGDQFDRIASRVDPSSVVGVVFDVCAASTAPPASAFLSLVSKVRTNLQVLGIASDIKGTVGQFPRLPKLQYFACRDEDVLELVSNSIPRQVDMVALLDKPRRDFWKKCSKRQLLCSDLRSFWFDSMSRSFNLVSSFAWGSGGKK